MVQVVEESYCQFYGDYGCEGDADDRVTCAVCGTSCSYLKGKD